MLDTDPPRGQVGMSSDPGNLYVGGAFASGKATWRWVLLRL